MGIIGIYGGTFNPPHMGHQRAAEYAVRALELDRLLVIPSCISPHKTLPEGSASPEQRLEMLQYAFAGKDRITVSDIELRRGGRSFTYETVEQVKALYPEDELMLLMGTDMFLSFHQWRCPERILRNAGLAVFYRGQKDEQQQLEQLAQQYIREGHKVVFVKNPVTDISSTQLRSLLGYDCAGDFLPEGVEDYIKDQKLYGTDRSYENLSVSQLEQLVTERLSEKRAAHVFRCRDMALELAQKYGQDLILAERAALLHDLTKPLDGVFQQLLCSRYGYDPEGWEEPTIHAYTGSIVAKHIFKECDQVVSAIRWHTTGRAGMTRLEQIIYLADTLEPGRTFPGVQELRSSAYEDLDKAMYQCLSRTLLYLQQEGRPLAGETKDALDFFRKRFCGKKD